jgi:hypothetical protein
MKTAWWSLGVLLLGSSASAEPVERRLHLSQVEASSYLINDWNRFQENYVPLYTGDDDPVTAWNDGVEGSPAGQWLRFHVSTLPGTTRVKLRVRNGYQKNQKIYAANARLRGATIVLLPSGVKKDVELTDAFGWQDLTVDQPAGPVEAVELRVRTIYAGTKYDDLAISDVQVHVTSTAAENPAYEKARFDKILAWKKERLAAAKLFKTTAAKVLPIAGQYAISADEQVRPQKDNRCKERTCYVANELAFAKGSPGGVKHAAALDRAVKLAREGFKSMAPVKAVARVPRPVPAVDGLCKPSLDVCEEDPCFQALPMPLGGQLAFLDAAGVGVLSVKDTPPVAAALDKEVPACKTRAGTKLAWAQQGPRGADGGPGKLEALLLFECGLVMGREGYYPQSTIQLLVYDGEGHLEVSAGTNYAAIYEWRAGEAGPLVASGWHTSDGSADVKIAEAVTVARK